jgi:hypothetical protein
MNVENVRSSLRWRLKTVVAWRDGLNRVLKTAPIIAVVCRLFHRSLLPGTTSTCPER